jgi:tetratricopeptide (TPR) repeat protein
MSSVEEYICSLGVVYYERGEYSSARSEFDKALVINPDNKIARDYLNRIALLNSYSPAKKD